jgi:hypothetical protein
MISVKVEKVQATDEHGDTRISSVKLGQYQPLFSCDVVVDWLEEPELQASILMAAGQSVSIRVYI